MRRIKKFVLASVVGGLVILVPYPTLYFAFRWLFETTTNIIEPITELFLRYINLPELVAEVLVLLGLIITCFLVGIFAQTSIGKFFHDRIDGFSKRWVPFFKLVKGLLELISNEDSGLLQSEVVMVEKNPGVYRMGLLTERCANGLCAVVFLLAVHPTTGFVHYFSEDKVHVLPGVSVQDYLRTLIACGIGSKELFEKSENKAQDP